MGAGGKDEIFAGTGGGTLGGVAFLFGVPPAFTSSGSRLIGAAPFGIVEGDGTVDTFERAGC